MAPPDLDRTIALFLDLDGTLLEIAPTPEQVVVPPGLPLLLANLHAQLGGALAIVTGRAGGADHLAMPFAPAAAGEAAQPRRWRARNMPAGVLVPGSWRGPERGRERWPGVLIR